MDRHNININVGPVPLAPVVAAFPAVTARYFRLAFSAPCEVGEVRLSPASRAESYAEKALLKMFQDLNRDEGITIILVTHSDEVAAFARRVVHIKDGAIAELAVELG